MPVLEFRMSADAQFVQETSRKLKAHSLGLHSFWLFRKKLFISKLKSTLFSINSQLFPWTLHPL